MPHYTTLTDEGISRVKAAPAQDSDFTFSGDGNNLASTIYGPRYLPTLSDQGLIKVSGDIATAQKFVDLFSLS